MHFNENPDSPEGLLDLPSVSDGMYIQYSVLLHNVYTSLFVLCLQIMFLFL